MNFLYSASLVLLAALITACGGGGGGGGGGGSGSAPEPTPDSPSTSASDTNSAFDGGFSSVDQASNNQVLTSCAAPTTINANSTITGTVSYQRVPLTAFGLDYSDIQSLPMRGVVVEAVDASNGDCSETVLATTLSNGLGEYGLNVDENQAVCIQIRAQIYRDGGNGGPSWNIQVTDNTSGNAPYYLLDNTVATPAERPERFLLAGAGVESGSSNYSLPRAAAPYAILDTLCEAVDTVLEADGTIELPLLSVRWSELNNSADNEGDDSIADGDIGGSFYRSQFFFRGSEIFDVTHEIFLLGDEDSNTDEYDAHVITHEFGHYLTGSFSRYDALGGPHAIGDRLDLRLAFEEGWADAFSGIALKDAEGVLTEDPAIYRNSLGFNQSRSSRFDLETNTRSVAGWYSEGSVTSILYNLFDDDNDTVDNLSLGFAPLFDVLTGDNYKATESLTSIYTFINQLKRQRSEDFDIDTLVAAQDTESINDDFGGDEDITNNDVFGVQDVEAVYTQLPLSDSIEVCSNNQFGTLNKLSVTQFLIFDGASERNYRFEISPVSGADGNGRAAVSLYRQGLDIINTTALAAGSAVSFSERLQGRHILSVAHDDYLQGNDERIGRRCFTVSVN